MTPDPIVAEFARLRAEHGWSCQELGRRAGISGRAIICLETGRNGATLHTVRALASVFGLEVEIRRLRPHGTLAAAKRHQYRREPMCEDCKRWDRERQRARRTQATVDNPVEPCGLVVDNDFDVPEPVDAVAA